MRPRLRVAREVDRELQSHLDLTIDELVAGGMSRTAAEQHALDLFGGYAAVAAECNEIRLHRTRQHQRSDSMHGIGQDLRFALRTLGRAPLFALVAVLTLALGIGTNVAVFGAVRALLLKPLPFAASDRLFAISLPKGQSFSKRRLRAIRERQASFESIAGYSRWGASLTGDGPPQLVRGAVGTADLFKVLGASAMLGRTFLPTEDLKGNERVIVLSHQLWTTRYGGDRSVIGRQLTFNGNRHTVVGVMPPGFDFPMNRTEFWVPTVVDSVPGDYTAGYLLLIGRLRPGVTPQRARDDIRRVILTLRADAIGGFSADDEAGFAIQPVRDLLVGKLARMLVLLLGAVAFILSIACVNVANLLLVRAARRRREFAVRTAIGAGRGRLVRQLLTESIVLSIGGAAVGVASALGFTRIISGLLPPDAIGANAVVIDPPVLAFAAVLSLAVGIGFGLVPALRSARGDLLVTLRAGQTAASGSGRRTMNGLIIGEFALASALAIGAALSVQSFWRLRSEDPGFRSSGVVSFRIEPPEASYDTPDRQRAMLSAIIDHLRAVPGVADVGAIQLLPLGDGNWNPDLVIEGRAAGKDGQLPEVDWRLASPGYFTTMGIPLLKGRLFAGGDDGGSQGVALINDALASRDFPGEDPLGKRVRTFFEGKDNWVTIVGIVGATKDQSLGGAPRPQMYRPFAQHPSTGMVLLVRAALNPVSLVPSIRRAVWAVDGNIPIADLRTLDDVVASSIGQPRMMALLLGSFGLLGLLLGAIGIYGVTSYAVSQRASELGLRMALGAQRRDVLRLVIVDALRLAAIGIGVGLVAAFWLSRLLRAQLYGVQPTDPATFVAVAVVLSIAGLLAATAPAWRASRIDPLIALREA